MSPTDTPGRAPNPLPGSPENGETLLRVTNLSKSFGSNQVLSSMDLSVAKGQVVVLIGPSGSGKTTVLRCLNGLETADGGLVDFPGKATVHFDQPVSKRQRHSLRDRSAMVFQHYNLFPHKTVLENVIEGPIQVKRRKKADATEEAISLLQRVGLEEKKDAYPFELSGGQQQRVGIVRALAMRPELLLFDEPTSSLDPELVGDVLTVIKELADEGWTMAVVTHELEFAKHVADEVLFMDGGVVVERGRPKDIFANPREARTQQFLRRLLHPL